VSAWIVADDRRSASSLRPALGEALHLLGDDREPATRSPAEAA
jgi:hypothetical protein